MGLSVDRCIKVLFVFIWVVLSSFAIPVWAEDLNFSVNPSNTYQNDPTNTVEGKMLAGQNWIFTDYIQVTVRKVDGGTFQSRAKRGATTNRGPFFCGPAAHGLENWQGSGHGRQKESHAWEERFH